MSSLNMLAAAAVLAAPALALAEPITELTVGDKAPEFSISHWLRGEPVSGFEPGSIYVMEFWATWCGPCKQAIPHVTALQEQYKPYGVTFIGVSDEKLETVRDFIAKDQWQQKMVYTVATDPDMSTYLDYMPTSGNGGIPTSFIIGKDGTVEWIGHPMDIDQPLDSVVKGTWDRDTFKKDWEKRMAPQRKSMQPRLKMMRAKQAGDWQTVATLLDEQIAANPARPGPKFDKFSVLLNEVNDPMQGYAFGREMVQAHWSDAPFLNRVAWFVVQDPKVKTRDLGFALDVAERASELTENKDAAILDTLARVQFDSGKVNQAIQTQTAAIEAAKSNPKTAAMVEELTATLGRYTNASGK